MTERVALVTGAASGIGAAAARRLANQGCRLVLVDRNTLGLDTLAREVGKENAITATFDVTEEPAWTEIEKLVRAQWGRLDYVVAAAGVAAASPLAEMALADWRRVIATNLDGVFLAFRTGLRLIGEGKRGGAMVTLSSAWAFKGEARMGAYSASKAAVAQLVKTAAAEGAPSNIRVNAIAPGGVETPLWRGFPFFQALLQQANGDEQAAFRVMGQARTPLGRFAKPAEIAELIAFVLSDKAPLMTGATLLTDGGHTL